MSHRGYWVMLWVIWIPTTRIGRGREGASTLARTDRPGIPRVLRRDVLRTQEMFEEQKQCS
eukprot:3708422-Pyramimonas_sp.AAC.1